MNASLLDQLQRTGFCLPLELQTIKWVKRQDADADASFLAAVLLLLRFNQMGHACLDLERFADRSLRESMAGMAGWEDKMDDRLPDLQLPEAHQWRASLQASPLVGSTNEARPFVLDGADRLYTFRYWRYEEKVADRLCRLARLRFSFDTGEISHVLDRLFPDCTDEPDWQRLAAAVAALSGLCVVSGGPGTGKTRTIAAMIILLEMLALPSRLRIALAAPTGKAAIRLQNSIKTTMEAFDLPRPITQNEAHKVQTLHRLLGVSRHSHRFRHHAGNPLPLDILVIDEVSMIDIAMVAKLLDALPENCRLVMVGDHAQLASVQAGRILGDICHGRVQSRFSKTFADTLSQTTGCSLDSYIETQGHSQLSDSIVVLQKNYRFASDSGIAALVNAVLHGDSVEAAAILTDAKYADLAWHEPDIGDTSSRAEKTFLDIVTKWYARVLGGCSADEALSRLGELGVLAVHRQGSMGVAQLNAIIESALEANGIVDVGDREWYHGRPVIVEKNDYALGLYNGDVGIALETETGLRVFFQGEQNALRSYSPSRLLSHNTAFALTVHKSQGSEYAHVLCLLPEDMSPIMTRELLYTAISRARSRFDLWCKKTCLETMISSVTERSSGLIDRFASDVALVESA